MAPLLHYFIVMAALEDGEGSGPPSVGNFMLLRTDRGLRIDETWDSMGMRSTGSHDLVLDDVALPADRLLNQRPLGSPDARGSSGAVWFSLGVSATTLGIARSARDYAVAFARERTPTTGRTIKEFPGVRTRIARIDLLLHRSRTLVHDAARAWESRDIEAPPDGIKPFDRAMMAKIDTLNNCIEAVDLAMRVVGGVSLLKSRPMERYYRDVRAALHNPPLEDRALEQIARSALDEPVEPPKALE